MPLLFDYWYSVISQPLYNMIFQWIGVSRFARGISLGGHFSSYHIDEVVWDKGLQQLAITIYQRMVSYKRIVALASHEIKEKLKVHDRTFPRNVNESLKYCRSQVIRINLNLLWCRILSHHHSGLICSFILSFLPINLWIKSNFTHGLLRDIVRELWDLSLLLAQSI